MEERRRRQPDEAQQLRAEELLSEPPGRGRHIHVKAVACGVHINTHPGRRRHSAVKICIYSNGIVIDESK